MCAKCFKSCFKLGVGRPHSAAQCVGTPLSFFHAGSYQAKAVAAFAENEAEEAAAAIREAVHASASVTLELPVPQLDKDVQKAIRLWMEVLTFSGRTNSAQLAAANPVAKFAGRPADCWKEHGWALILPTEATRTLARELDRFVHEKQLFQLLPELGPDGNKRQSIIAGGVVQTLIEGDHAEGDQFAAALRKSTDAAVKLVAPNFFNGGKASYTGTKSLVSSSNQGMQPIHWDSPRWGDVDDEQCAITTLFYGKDCDTTLVPAFSADRFTPEVDQHNQLLMMARARLLDKRFFCSASVKAGTLLLFRHSVPHAGVVCREERRIVLFNTLTRTPKGLDAEPQYFEWNYNRDAFGARSKEYSDSLMKNDKLGHEPIEREGPSERRALRVWLGLKQESSKLDEDEKPTAKK